MTFKNSEQLNRLSCRQGFNGTDRFAASGRKDSQQYTTSEHPITGSRSVQKQSIIKNAKWFLNEQSDHIRSIVLNKPSSSSVSKGGQIVGVGSTVGPHGSMILAQK